MLQSGFLEEFDMSGTLDMLTGKTAKDAARAQALARERSSVAQARQLSTAADDAARTALSRKGPRGRRLLADAGPAALPATVG